MGLPLKGSPNDLDELLVEAAKLKKFAMAWLGESVSNDRGNGFEEDCRDRIREYLQTFLRFLRRYIGRQPIEDDEVKDHEAFYKKISMSKNIVIAAVDSAVVMGKVSIASQSPAWEEMLSIL
ncbi:separase, partial [Aspergillus sclerotialis]